MRSGAPRAHAQRPRRLSPEDDRGLTARPALAGLEAEAGVPAGEAGAVREAAGPPLLVGDEQERQLGEGFG